MTGQVVECPGCSGQFVVASAAFDPYYTWLGIPPAQQPPDLYRLLGLQLFEPNRQVIENAADRQMLLDKLSIGLDRVGISILGIGKRMNTWGLEE